MQGITPAFIRSTMDALMRNELVRVQLGGSGVDRGQAAKVFEQLMDCVNVFEVGAWAGRACRIKQSKQKMLQSIG